MSHSLLTDMHSRFECMLFICMLFPSLYTYMYVGGPDVVLDFHDVVWLSSNAPVILTSGQSVAAVCETDPLMRAHGIHGRGKPTHACTCLYSMHVCKCSKAHEESNTNWSKG